MSCLVCVRTQEVAVVEDLGQFKQLIDPGFHCIMWPIQNVAGTLSLRIQQLDVYCETKTKDNVFVNVAVAVQFRYVKWKKFKNLIQHSGSSRVWCNVCHWTCELNCVYLCPLHLFSVITESAYDAFYRLSDPRGQIQSYVFDVVRSTVPRMELDEAFASKSEIANATLQQLETVMRGTSW